MAEQKLSALSEDTSPTTDDYTITLDLGSGVTKKVKWQNVMAMAAQYVLPSVYPVGCIYTEITGVNPNTTLGFGTWTSFGQGRTLVGRQSIDTDFDTAEETGGEKTHVLTTAEMPAHSHGVNDPGHAHSSNTSGQTVFTASSTNTTTDNRGGGFQQITWGNTSTSSNGTGISTQNAGSGSAHNNMPPYIVVYFWKRTA